MYLIRKISEFKIFTGNNERNCLISFLECGSVRFVSYSYILNRDTVQGWHFS